jgi:hypothetical protein
MNGRLRWMGLVGVCSSVACGGNAILEGGGDASANDSGVEDGGAPDAIVSDGGALDSSPPLVHGCPATAPAAGASCVDETLECEYGGAWWSVSCDVVMQCEGGEWQSARPSYEPCSSEPGPNPTSCPATSSSVPQGSVCPASDTSCYYPDAFCQCIVPLGGPAEIDGGTAYWSCLPGDGCPYPRPPLGSACSASSSNDCTYEQCSYGQSCVGGAWQASEEACASSGL